MKCSLIAQAQRILCALWSVVSVVRKLVEFTTNCERGSSHHIAQCILLNFCLADIGGPNLIFGRNYPFYQSTAPGFQRSFRRDCSSLPNASGKYVSLSPDAPSLGRESGRKRRCCTVCSIEECPQEGHATTALAVLYINIFEEPKRRPPPHLNFFQVVRCPPWPAGRVGRLTSFFGQDCTGSAPNTHKRFAHRSPRL